MSFVKHFIGGLQAPSDGVSAAWPGAHGCSATACMACEHSRAARYTFTTCRHAACGCRDGQAKRWQHSQHLTYKVMTRAVKLVGIAAAEASWRTSPTLSRYICQADKAARPTQVPKHSTKATMNLLL